MLGSKQNWLGVFAVFSSIIETLIYSVKIEVFFSNMFRLFSQVIMILHVNTNTFENFLTFLKKNICHRWFEHALYAHLDLLINFNPAAINVVRSWLNACKGRQRHIKFKWQVFNMNINNQYRHNARTFSEKATIN